MRAIYLKDKDYEHALKVLLDAGFSATQEPFPLPHEPRPPKEMFSPNGAPEEGKRPSLRDPVTNEIVTYCARYGHDVRASYDDE